MKKLFIITTLILLVCIKISAEPNLQQLISQAQNQEIAMQPVNSSNNQESETEEEAQESTDYIGTWLRQATYVSGALQHQTPATLIYKKDTYSSSGTCSTSGTIKVKGNSIKTVMLQSNCPGGVQPPFTVVYTYSITDDGKTLTLVSGSVKEIYKRKQ